MLLRGKRDPETDEDEDREAKADNGRCRLLAVSADESY